MIEKQVIVQWYTPEEKSPENDIAVVATISGKARKGLLTTFDHALVIMFYDENEGWYSLEYDFEELTVHAWCDIDPYEG